MSVKLKLSNIVLSALFISVQSQGVRASDDFKEEQKKSSSSYSTSKKKSTKSPNVSESSSTSAEITKPGKKKKSSSQPAQPVGDLLDSLIGIQLKKDIFVAPKQLDKYETLLVLFSEQDIHKRNCKIYLAAQGAACNFDTLHKGKIDALYSFFHATRIKTNEGFKGLKDAYLIENPKAKVITTKAEKITKSLKSTSGVTAKLSSKKTQYSEVERAQLRLELTQIEDNQRAYQGITNSRALVDALLLELNPGDDETKNLFGINARYEYDERRPVSTLASHNSVYGWYRLYLDNDPTEFVFGVNLYRMQVK